jgi:type I restriction enzyme S subunit
LVFTCWGTVGQLGIIEDKGRFDEYLVSNKQMKMTVDVNRVIPLYLYYFLSQVGMIELVRGQAIGSSVPGFNLGQLKALPVRLPALQLQRAIAQVLGALDDKIAANEQTALTSRELANARFVRCARGGLKVQVSDAVEMLSRGVTPSYIERDGMLVLNQKCVRNQRVTLDPARVMVPLTTRIDRVLRQNDVLVNSTGAGTLGRTARWTHGLHASVDSHVTIVRFDANVVDPVCAGFALLRLESQIEALAEGSTGQTELRRDLLGGLTIEVPGRSIQRSLGAELDNYNALELSLLNGSRKLAATRDELLPLLMSGRVRVKDAEAAVNEVL